MGLFDRLHEMASSGVDDKKVAKSAKYIQDEEGLPAVSLAKVEAEGGVDLKKKVQTIGVSLRKRGLSGMRAQVLLVLDHSYSMSSDYNSGAVQALVEKFLAFGLQIDIDGKIPVIPFDDSVKSEVEVNMSNYRDIVDSRIYNYSQMGSTNLTDALKKVREIAKETNEPLFVAILTDGEPNDKHSSTEIVKDLARYPVFLKFLAVRPVNYLQELDDLGNDVRLLDNVDSKSFRNASSVSDEEFAEAMADEWDTWVKAALAAGVLTQ